MAFRSIPPAGGFPTFRLLAASRREFANEFGSHPYTSFIEKLLGLGHLHLHNSGTEALAFVLRQLSLKTGAEEVLVSGYTCPDIVTGAVSAGLKVIPCDIDPVTFSVKYTEGASSSKAIAVLSNLYGIPELLPEQLLIVDDACQAALSRRGDTPVGAVKDTAAVFSFGRGKAFCGCGGGASRLPTDFTSAPFEEVDRAFRSNLLSQARFYLIQALQHPNLYWIPESLPFLHLGETAFEPELAESSIAAEQLMLGAAAIMQAAETINARRNVAAQWKTALSQFEVLLPVTQSPYDVVPIRYPVIFPSQKLRDSAHSRLKARGLGASTSYREDLSFYCASHPNFQARELPGAKLTAACLLTLPVHDYVTERDIERAAEEISRVFKE